MGYWFVTHVEYFKVYYQNILREPGIDKCNIQSEMYALCGPHYFQNETMLRALPY